MTVTVKGEAELLQFYRELPDKLQRQAARTTVAAQAQALVKEQRNQLKSMVSTEARSRGGRGRAGVKNNKGLAKGIVKKVWASAEARRAGIIAQMVGGEWPSAAHGHLIEYGHRIYMRDGWGSAIPTGGRTAPKPFTRIANRKAWPAMYRMGADRLSKWIAKQEAKKTAVAFGGVAVDAAGNRAVL